MRSFTDEQHAAIERRTGSLLLAAAAGSGKTSVLVERFVRSVLHDGVAPAKILAITFTERAAGELRERIRARLLAEDARAAAREVESASISTFHGFCARLLRNHPLQAGIEPSFQILEEGFASRLRTLAFSDALAGLLAGEPPQAVDLVAAYGAERLRAMVLAAHAQLRSQGESVPRLPLAELAPPVSSQADEPPRQLSLELDASHGEEENERRLRADALATCALIGELLERFEAAYSQRKQARDALDFDDLELRALALLQSAPELRQAWSERFELLMVDEFQDCSPRQLRLLAALDRDNLFTVGDELQSIYGFRHADVSLFRARRERLAERGASLALTRNFRSHPQIIAAVQRIFAQRMGERFTPLQAGIEPDDGEVPARVELLLTDKRGWDGDTLARELEGMPQATPWRQAEARLLAERVAELIDAGHARAGEIVLLLRSLGDLPVYESALRRRGLPTLAGAGGFWSDQQVGDLLAWLRALANPLDELALYATLASPLVGLSSDGLALLSSIKHGDSQGLWTALESAGEALLEALPESDGERLRRFRDLFAAERRTMALRPLAELLRRAIHAGRYEQHVLSLNWGARRLANVHKLIRLAREYEAQEGRDLRGFLDHATHLGAELKGREADGWVGDRSGEQLEAVRIMSIHAAKGLEFPVVCVVDLGREPNLRMPDLLLDVPTRRIGLRLQDLADPESRPALDYVELSEERRTAQLEEEERILYVACTRAERRLLLSGAVAFESWPTPRAGAAPISWLASALVPDAPKLAEAAAQSSFPLRIDTGEAVPIRLALGAAVHGLGESPSVEPAVEAKSETFSSGSPRLGAGQVVPAPLQGETAVSYTSLSELERCGYRYYLERTLHMRENRAAARGGGSREPGAVQARARGTIVHGLLETVDFKHPVAPTAQQVAGFARRLGVRVDAKGRQEIATLVAAALQAAPAQLLAEALHIRREHPFQFELEPSQPLFTGFFDLVATLPDGSELIVDYKSDRLEDGEDLELHVQREYGLQRLLYALAAIEAGAREVQVAHWFLESPEAWRSVRLHADQRDELRASLLERIERLRSRGYAVSETPHRELCLTCPGRGGLCSWGESRTLRARFPPLEFQG